MVMTDKSKDTSSARSGIKRRKYLALTAAGATGFAGCLGGDDGDGDGGGDGAGDSPTPSPGVAEDEIPIGSFLPLSGAGSAFGPAQQTGFNIAAADINEAGGTNKGTIRPINRDTETEPSRAAAKLQDLLSAEDIPAFAGTWSSGVSSTLAPIAADNGVFQMGCGTTSPLLAEQGWRDVDGESVKFFGRTSPNDGMQGIAIAQVLNETLGVDSVAFIHVDNPYGEGLVNVAARDFEGEVVAQIGLPEEGVEDYAGVLDEAYRDNPDALVLVTYEVNGEAILKQRLRGGYGGDLVLAEAMFIPDLFNELIREVEGAYVTTMEPELNPSWDYFTQAMEEEGQAIATFSSHSYDAMFLIGLALHKADEVSGVEIARNIVEVSRPSGEEILAGADGFQEAKDLIDQGEDINYEGASSTCDLHECFKEPYNRIAIYQIVEGTDDPHDLEEVDLIEADFFEGKVYTDQQIAEFCE